MQDRKPPLPPLTGCPVSTLAVPALTTRCSDGGDGGSKNGDGSGGQLMFPRRAASNLVQHSGGGGGGIGPEHKCACGLPNSKFCMLVDVIDKMGRPHRQITWVPMSICSTYATTTPSAPFSSTDLIGSYNNDQSRLAGSDEFRHSSLAEVDKRRSGGERRPSSRGKNKHSPNAEKEREGRDISLPGKHEENGLLPLPTKRNHFKPSGVRNNFLTGHNAQIIGQSPPKPLLPSQPTTAEVDELVAMGTNWNPSPGQRNGRLGNSTHGGSTYTSSKPRNGRLSTGYQFNSGSTTKTNNPKEIEPKYSDPVVGAPPSFQQRLSELGTLEADTIRWERTKKLKKKSKES